jgi:hypothetical protein
VARIWRVADAQRILGFLVADDDEWWHVSEAGVHALHDANPLDHVSAASALPDVPGRAEYVANELYRSRPGADSELDFSEPPIL